MNANIELYHLPKKYKGINAQIANIQTFTNECENKKKVDAKWILDEYIQSPDLTSNVDKDGISFVALGEILKKKVVFKVMNDGWRSKKEKKSHRVFREFPHRNIIRSICDFTCKDNKIKWLNPKNKPDILCDKKGDTELTIIIQEYLPYGDYYNFRELFLKKSIPIEKQYGIWKSSILQILFTSIELFDKFGYINEDWSLKNILIGITSDKTIKYKAFNKIWIVNNSFWIAPIFTDFSRVDFLLKRKNPWHLAVQLSYALDMMKNICPNESIKKITEDYSSKIELLESYDDIIICLEKYIYII